MPSHYLDHHFSDESLQNQIIGGKLNENIISSNKRDSMSSPDESYIRQSDGKFHAIVRQKGTDSPIKGATVTISPLEIEGDTTRQTSETALQTNEFGKTNVITLVAPPKEYSLQPTGAKPYSEYIVNIKAPGYVPIEIYGAQIYGDTTAIQKIELTPVSDTDSRQPQSERIDIPAPTLSGEYPQQEPQSHNPGQNLKSEIVHIPDFITVHDGHPETAAYKHRVRFTDYIKNVAASEIYPSWPKECLRANILCILSFTLNKLHNNHYRSKGLGFDITSSTQFDHKYIHGRNTFDETDNVVDELIGKYISKPNKYEPFLAQYCQGPGGTNCQHGGLSQWGSKILADQGKTHLEILFHYFIEVEIRFVEDLTTIKPYPGQNLVTGSTGIHVKRIQRYLNVISKKYPEIPTLIVDGLFEQQTKISVIAFQKIHSLAESGIVDNYTWIKITDIYIYVINLPDVYPVLKIGSSGEMVKKLQGLLNKAGFNVGEEDGSFGTNTETTVKEFQEAKGLPADGIVGRQTWDALERSILPGQSRTYLPSLTDSRTLSSASTYHNNNSYKRKYPYFTGRQPGYYTPYVSPGSGLPSEVPDHRTRSTLRKNY
ncbi:peptidoglycan-binding protein [Bacillus sp. SM2101]|uniref:peptidoglycan-binding protein n=1 Tax=Bacillus sp. SM2101 TaxID=2805366 RepID=UPI001BDF0CC6|nr:peptidoglycan-binding protein [Bacillus sp. SM2101]